MIIREAEGSEDIATVRRLFLEYADSLGFDLCFQDFDRELGELPGAYAPPGGALLLAYDDDCPVGCVAMRGIGEGICEMKRLYVRPAHRGRGTGRALAGRIVDAARAAGYRAMRLDTIETMREAIALYRSMGFMDTSPYRHNPICGAVYLELDLARNHRRA
jgi:ribosomal protein S18 acetylase RimI-like enzyme